MLYQGNCRRQDDLNQMTTQLEAKDACKNENLDSVTAEAGNARIKEDKSKLRKRLEQLQAENKKLKSDLGNTFNDAKKSM
nr:unnamed protein product [Callosobruchus chinensis]